MCPAPSRRLGFSHHLPLQLVTPQVSLSLGSAIPPSGNPSGPPSQARLETPFCPFTAFPGAQTVLVTRPHQREYGRDFCSPRTVGTRSVPVSQSQARSPAQGGHSTAVRHPHPRHEGSNRAQLSAASVLHSCTPPLPPPRTCWELETSYNKAPPRDSGFMVPRVPHKPDHGIQVVYQRLVPPEDLGPGAPVIGEPVPKVGHQGRKPTGVEHRLKGPAGNEDGHSRPPLTSPGRDRGQGGEGGGRATTLTPTTTTVGIAIIMSFVCAVGWLGGGQARALGSKRHGFKS